MENGSPSELKQALERIVCENQYASVTFHLDLPIYLNRWLITSAINSRDYTLDANVKCNLQGSVLTKDEVEHFSEFEKESNWRFYISDDANSFYKRNSPEKMFNSTCAKEKEKYIYSLCCVYASEDSERLIHISTMMPMPLRLWINGNLVYTGTITYFIKNHIFAYQFQKGINTILVEKCLYSWNRQLALTPKYFSVSIRSIQSVIDNDFAVQIHQMEILEKHLNSFTIMPNKLFYDSNEKIQLIVFHNKQVNESIEINLSTVNGEYFRIISTCNRVIALPIPYDLTGIIKISVAQRSKFVFVGDYNNYFQIEMDKLNNYSDLIDKYSLLFNLTVLDSKNGFINKSIEPIHDYYSQPVLKKFFATGKYLNSNEACNDLYGGFVAIESPIDGDTIASYMELPFQYDVQKKYPLVVYLNFDDSLTRIPTNPHRTLSVISVDSISLTFCGRVFGRGDYNSDYLNTYEIIHAIKTIAKMYNIDNNKISLFGICTGGRKSFDLAYEYPNLFSSLFSFVSTSVKVKELDQAIPLIQLCHIDDIFYNGATVFKRIDLTKNTFEISGFEHEELIDYYCNANTAAILNQFVKVNNDSNKKSEKIRDIYLNHCSIIRPQLLDQKLTNKLMLHFGNPLKMRARNYHFPFINESNFLEIDMKNKNFIYLVKINNFDIKSTELKRLYLQIINKKNIKKDDSLIVSIENNPYDINRKILFVLYDNEQSLTPLINLWDKFDREELFDSKTIIYNNDHLWRKSM